MTRAKEVTTSQTETFQCQKSPPFDKCSSLLALSLVLLALAPDGSAATLNQFHTFQIERAMSTPIGITTGETLQQLTTNEKELATKLCYDEKALALIKTTLMPEMGIVKSGGLEDEDREFFKTTSSLETPLLEEDRQNYEDIAKEFPELKPLVYKALESSTRNLKEITDFITQEEKNEFGEERYNRYKRFNTAVKPYAALMKQELALSQPNSSKVSPFVSPEAFESDEALDKAIESIKLRFTGKELLPENKGTLQLGLKFMMPSEDGLPAPEILEKLQDSLVQQGYRLSKLQEEWPERKSFKSKQEAEQFLNSDGSNNFLIFTGKMREQKCRQYEITYPPDQAKRPENNPSNITSEEPPSHIYAQLTVSTLAPQENYLRTEVCNPQNNLELLPGATVRKLGSNRWQITVPARYIAERTVQHATVLKVPADSLGLELLHANGKYGSSANLTLEKVIAKLKHWDKKYGLTILGANSEVIKVRFKKLPEDLSELSLEMFLFCPQINLSTNEETNASKLREAAHQLRETNKTTFWWSW